MIIQTGISFVDSNTMADSHEPPWQWFLDAVKEQAECGPVLSRHMPFFRKELGLLEVTHNPIETFFTVLYSGCYGPSKTPYQTIKVYLKAYAKKILSPTSDKPGYYILSIHDSENNAIFMAEGDSPFSLDGGFSRIISSNPMHVIDAIRHLMSTGYLTRKGIPDDVQGGAP